MSAGISGKRVVVIGGSAGIGLAVARAAIEEGASVVIASSNQARVAQAASQLDGAEGHALDVTSERAVEAFFEKVGPFDHLVYTAGDWNRPADPWDLESASSIFRVRFWGALTAIKHARKTIASDGSITVTDGVAAHRPRRGAAVNSASAGALEHLVGGLAVDLAPIRVNCVCPGVVLTDVWNNLPQGAVESMTRRQPIPRGAHPDEIAEAYRYLMRATFTTGQVVIVDGGYLLV